MRVLTLVLALLVCGAVEAQNPPTNIDGLDFRPNNALAVSAALRARVKYNSGTGTLQTSISGATYADLLALTTQSANKVLSGPASGADATPTFRFLVAGDIPSLSTIYLPLGGGTLTGPLTLSTTSIQGTYNLAGNITLQSSIGITADNTYIFGDSTHRFQTVWSHLIGGGAASTLGHVVPDIADDTFALLAAAQTLTNKTINAQTNTIINLGVALFSFVDFANNHTGATLNAGNFSMGSIFYLVTNGICTGGRFYWAGGGGALTVKVSLWDSTNTRVKNCSVAVNAAGVYSCTFSTPQTITDIYQVYTIGFWEDSGTNFTTFQTPSSSIRLLPNNNRTDTVTTPTSGGTGYANGKTIVSESNIFAGGDAQPDPASILFFADQSPVEAIIQ